MKRPILLWAALTLAVFVLAVWLGRRATPQADTPGPFFVTPDGSASSSCSQAEPCTLTRAVALVNNGTINDCAVVRVAGGYYSQAALNISGSGRADCRITFLGTGDANLTGTRQQYPPEAWSLTPGMKYTYQVSHDDAIFNSSNPAQRNPSNWQPILVANNATTDRVVTLDFPPRYSNVDSVAKVEAQSCTHYDDVNANLVYVHPCDDKAPSAASDLWLSSTGWGTVTISGHYITLDGINLQHSQKSGANGFEIATGANATIVRRFNLRATGMTLKGTNTIIEDGEAGYVILQGPSGGKQCFNRSGFGIGACWNAQGSGSAVDLGISGSTASYGGVMRRVRVHDSWNGFSLNGANTAEDNIFENFPNHTVGFGGTGGAFRRNVMCNGQDSLYSEGNNFDELTVEYNLACNGTLFWVSRDGVGGTPPKRWTLRGNIFPSLVVEDKTFTGLLSDCNVVIESVADPGADLFRITGSDGAPGRNYNTLKEWQAATQQDVRSVELPFTEWTTGVQFERFTFQNARYDFSPPPTAQALKMTSCGTYVGPYGKGR